MEHEVARLPQNERKNDELDEAIQRLALETRPGAVGSRDRLFVASDSLLIDGHPLPGNDCFVGQLKVRAQGGANATGDTTKTLLAILIDNWLFCLEWSRAARLYTVTALYGTTHYTFLRLQDEWLGAGADSRDTLLQKWLAQKILPLTHPHALAGLGATPAFSLRPLARPHSFLIE
jgi:hypothetical protein